MAYFDNKKNVDDYIKMVDGYDGTELVNLLQEYLVEDSTLLELGMGPGKDLDLLRTRYKVTGSDSSQIFLDIYRGKHPEADLLRLDARTIETDRRFDCIYSNKVLHHLHREDLVTSLHRQHHLLNDEGVLMHTFWYGTSEEEHNGLRFVYYTEDDLTAATKSLFEVLRCERYGEMNNNDSILLVLKKSNR